MKCAYVSAVLDDSTWSLICFHAP